MGEEVEKLLRELEGRLLDGGIRSDPEAVAAMLAEDFREFGSSGRVFTRGAILTVLAAEKPREIELSEFRCERVAEDVALVTYRSLSRAEGETPVEALRSSIWVRRGARWQVVFHQGTRL